MRGPNVRPRALLIDWGGTLCPENLPPLSDQLAASRLNRFIRRFPAMSPSTARAAVDALVDAAEQASVESSDAPIEECAHALGLDLAVVRACMHVPAIDICSPFPGAAELLVAAKALGLARVVVTNTAWHTHDTCQSDFANFGLDVDEVITSVDVGARKPNAKIFEAALALVCCPASAVVYIGNDEFRDIRPTREMGMRTIRVAIEEPLPSCSEADVICCSLADARECLRRWIEE